LGGAGARGFNWDTPCPSAGMPSQRGKQYCHWLPACLLQAGTKLGKLYYETWRQAGNSTAAVGGTCATVGVSGFLLGEQAAWACPMWELPTSTR
jgi:hypothetical protein